ncbi:uncharacterized protein A4U43_C07F26670 [Asparagus officinalis]|uniref:Uncharacterized protein n=1 Tax=Asparagus officinalis TaxID=4686 RepID=A0A5P1EF22_ASPOF|nr:uncharacterized protein A4U43_C07F26670 [Asparagus officinalis]
MEWMERKMSSTSGHSNVSDAIGPPGSSNEIVNCVTVLSALEGIDSTQFFLKATRVLHDDTINNEREIIMRVMATPVVHRLVVAGDIVGTGWFCR